MTTNPRPPCKFCKEQFKRRVNGHRREYCFKPECVALHDQEKQAYFREYCKTHKQKPSKAAKSYRTRNKARARKKKRLCKSKGRLTGCKIIIDNANRDYCSFCHGYRGQNVIYGEAI